MLKSRTRFRAIPLAHAESSRVTDKLLPTNYPVGTVDGTLDILAALDDDVDEVLQGVGEVGRIVERWDSREGFDVCANVIPFSEEDFLPRKRVAGRTLRNGLANRLRGLC